MHYLCFKLDQNRFAIPSKSIDRVFPLLALTEMMQSPSYIAGYFHYQGQFIVTIDLTQLINARKSALLMSSRIVVIEFTASNERRYKIAILIEEALETLKITEEKWKNNPLISQQNQIGGKIANINNIAIQQILLDKLFSEDVLALIHEFN
ncbi:chemotaxis protein CheW [Psychromonas sp. KJ10-10]|uniref:chemotaxis protein CheW n=1 Tax=Psychromonas sp. KJ10-10 TaxID=3391823 RepID=UPI0039B5C493